MKDVYDLSTMSKALHMTNFYKKQKKMDQSVFNIKLFKSFLLGYLKLKKL